MSDNQLDYLFPVAGSGVLPADHAYPLYAALCRVLPEFHEHAGDDSSLPWRYVGVLPITGALVGSRALRLSPRSALRIRAPAALYGKLLHLVGASLDIAGSRVTIGVPRLHPLRPASTLRSRLVIIKGCLQPEAFLDAVTRQLETLGVRCSATLAARRGQRPLEGGVGAHPDSRFIRRTVRIRDREVVGYAVKLSNLDPDGSLVVQARGIGGRRKFGAGIFLPSK